MQSCERLLESFFAAWSRHDANAVVAHYHDDAVMEDPLLPLPINGKEAVHQYYRRSFATYPDATHHLISSSASDERLFFEWDYTITLQGRPVTCYGTSIFRLRDGLIVRDTSYWDPRALEQARGSGRLARRRLLLLAAPLFEDIELYYPLIRLKEEGAEVVVAGTSDGIYRGAFWSLMLAEKGRARVPGVPGDVFKGIHGMPIATDMLVEAVDADHFDGVIIPGGYACDHFRRCESLLELLRAFDRAGKVIAAICHGGWVLASAGLAAGKRLTGLYAIKVDLVNAGAVWVDEAVVVDGHLITSRFPDDLPDFCQAIIMQIGSGATPQASTTGAG
jgi:protease I